MILIFIKQGDIYKSLKRYGIVHAGYFNLLTSLTKSLIIYNGKNAGL